MVKVLWGATRMRASEDEKISRIGKAINTMKRLSRFEILPNWDGRKDPRVLKDLPKASYRKESERKASERRTTICKWDHKRRAEKIRNANEKRDERAEEWTSERMKARQPSEMDEMNSWNQTYNGLKSRYTSSMKLLENPREENHERITLNFFIAGSLSPVFFFFLAGTLR